MASKKVVTTQAIETEIASRLQTNPETGLGVDFVSQLLGARQYVHIVGKTESDKREAYHNVVPSEVPLNYTSWLKKKHNAYNQSRLNEDKPPVPENCFIKNELLDVYAKLDTIMGAFHAEMKLESSQIDLNRINKLMYLASVIVQPAKELELRGVFGLAQPVSFESFFGPTRDDRAINSLTRSIRLHQPKR